MACSSFPRVSWDVMRASTYNTTRLWHRCPRQHTALTHVPLKFLSKPCDKPGRVYLGTCRSLSHGNILVLVGQYILCSAVVLSCPSRSHLPSPQTRNHTGEQRAVISPTADPTYSIPLFPFPTSSTPPRPGPEQDDSCGDRRLWPGA